jgi:hypothetical protein
MGQNRSAFVIPAQAGIQQGWTLRSLRSAVGWTWIPACAGMRFLFFFAYLCAADTALAEPSGAGGGALAHSPQAADSIGNVSVRHFAPLRLTDVD